MTNTAGINETIQSAITQLSEDKKIFDKFEIDSRFIERYTRKYSRIEGNTKVFDFWAEKYSEIKTQVQNINSIIDGYKRAFEKQFENCSSCVKILRDTIKAFPNYQESQIRANIDLFNLKTTLMVLYKTSNSSYPEDNQDYNRFLKAIYDVQEKCNTDFSPSQYSLKTLFHDDNVSTNLIQHDFPISIRM